MKHLQFIFLTLLLFSICCKQPKSKPQEEHKTVFKYNEPGGIQTLDPAYARNLEDIWAMNQLFNGLVQMDSGLRVKPCIANRWEISKNGHEYTFHLRDDIYFHDHPLFENGKGRKVTAQDFVYSFFRIIDPDIASYGFSLLNNYIDKSEKNSYKGFVALNDSVLRIDINKPNNTFLSILTMQYFSVIPSEIAEHYGKDFRRNPVGTGPFVFKMWSEGAKLILVKNENYFEYEGNEHLPYLDAVSITFVKDRQLAFLDFVRHNYDFLSGIDESFKDQMLSGDGSIKSEYVQKFRMEKIPYIKTDYLGVLMDEKSPVVKSSPMKIKAVRQAISYGIDREKMVKYLRNNIGVPATAGFVPPGLPSFSKQLRGYSYQPEKAAELLKTAGYPEGKGLAPITITTPPLYETLCEFIQHELNMLGIALQIEVVDEATFREMAAQSKINLFRKNWIGDYPDAENFLSVFYSKNFSPSGPNYTHYMNMKYDRLYEKALAEPTDSLRFILYRQMDQMIMDDSPVIPLYYDEAVRFIHNDVQGLESNPMNLLFLKKVRKIAKLPE